MADDGANELSAEQREELIADLHVLESRLQGAIAAAEDASAPVDLDQPIGRVSRIDAIQQQKMAESSRRQHKARLRLVTGALLRARGDDFGRCIQCEEPIGFRRLKARPESLLCLTCQASAER